MGHGPSTDWGKDNAAAYKQRLGLYMFALYAVVYGGFIIINVLSPKLMGQPFGGVNVAVAYGFGLILFALILAFVYNALCTRTEERLNQRVQDLSDWFDQMKAAGRLPANWDKATVMVFAEAMVAADLEISFNEDENLSAIEAFQYLFEGKQQ